MALTDEIMRQIDAADEAGIKLEMIEGLPVWEFLPTLGHQQVVQKAFLSVRPGSDGSSCAAISVMDVLIVFPDGSYRRPDLSIFCAEPSPRDKAVETIPAAVVEVISADSRKKDLKLGPPFYLKHGVLDVVAIDPLAKKVTHFTAAGRREITSPSTIELQCRCTVDV